MEALVGLAFVVGLIIVIQRWTRSRSGRSRFKCANCAHRRRLFEDGVLCGYGNREVFKNRRHIALCMDWTQESKRSGQP